MADQCPLCQQPYGEHYGEYQCVTCGQTFCFDCGNKHQCRVPLSNIIRADAWATPPANHAQHPAPFSPDFTEGQIVHHTDRDSYGQIDTIVATGEGDTETVVLYIKELNDDTGEFSGPLRAWFADHCTVADTEPAEVPNCYVPGYGYMII